MYETVYPTDDIDQLDELARVLESESTSPVILTSTGRQMPLPSEVVQALLRTVEMLARGKAVVISPQSRVRFV